MKVEDLKVGEIYKCKLSQKDVLIVEVPEQISTDEDGDETVVSESRNAGKFFIEMDNGDYKFVCAELHDGQLEEK